jgi:hypothetical protein
MVFYTIANKLHEKIYDMCLRDFGLKPMPFIFTEWAKYDEKTGEKISERRELKGERTAPRWAIREARESLIRNVRILLSCCTKANLIYPVTLIDFGERRKYQTKAIAQCSLIPHKIEFFSRKIGFKLEPWKHILRDFIELEKVLKGWRASDKVFETRILKAYAKKETRIRREELHSFLISHGTFLDKEDLKTIFDTEDPWEVLKHTENMIGEIIFGVTPSVRALLNEDLMKKPFEPVKENPFEKRVDGHSFKDMMNRNNPFKEKENTAPPDPVSVPKDPLKPQLVITKPPVGRLPTEVYHRNPDRPDFDSKPYSNKKKPGTPKPAFPTIAEMIEAGEFSKVMEEAYSEHNANVEEIARKEGEEINKKLIEEHEKNAIGAAHMGHPSS